MYSPETSKELQMYQRLNPREEDKRGQAGCSSIRLTVGTLSHFRAQEAGVVGCKDHIKRSVEIVIGGGKMRLVLVRNFTCGDATLGLGISNGLATLHGPGLYSSGLELLGAVAKIAAGDILNEVSTFDDLGCVIVSGMGCGQAREGSDENGREMHLGLSNEVKTWAMR